jgi:hypothetical protein
MIVKVIASNLATVMVCAAALGAGTAFAQAPAASFPNKPLRIIVPYPPGGTSDILSRMIGVKITENWGQSVIVENRTGANGNIGAEFVARAPADGYTYLLTDIGNLSIAPNVYKLPFDILRDFTPVTTVSYSPHLLTTHPSVPVKTTRELVALAKANPGKLNFSTGLGGAPHFAGLLFAQRTGIAWAYRHAWGRGFIADGHFRRGRCVLPRHAADDPACEERPAEADRRLKRKRIPRCPTRRLSAKARASRDSLPGRGKAWSHRRAWRPRSWRSSMASSSVFLRCRTS